MKLIVSETFQFRGIHRSGTELTVSATLLKTEIERGKHPEIVKGVESWNSGLMEHCLPANDETAEFITDIIAGKPIMKNTDKKKKKNDSKAIREIWAEFDLMGKAYDKRWRLKRLTQELTKAKKAVGDIRKAKAKEETIIEG